MKSTAFLIVTLLFIHNIFAQNKWITDSEMKFKIQVPNNYQQNQFRDGTDKILALVSPDENVAVRVRAMHATSGFTPDLLQQVFEESIISGAQLLMAEKGDLHGISAKAAAYIWTFNNVETVVGTYYIVQNGFAYVVWTIVPKSLLQQRSAEADKILDSFELLQPQQKSGGLLGGIGNIGNSPSTQNTTSLPTTKKIDPNYLEMVSDDACVEHLFPKKYKVTKRETGQLIFEDSSGIKMIQQTITKQGKFRDFMSNQVSNIAGQGAEIVKSEFENINGLDVLQYFYTYGNTYFAYFAVENNSIFYLLGFVGDKSLKNTIIEYSDYIKKSIKKAPCSSSSSSVPGIKTATISHLGFDFSTGQKGFADGETVGWCSKGSHPKYSKGVWWRSSGDTKYKNMGNVSLNSVTSIPSSWDNPAIPLLQGNVYVIKCTDGYAAIKVISVNENGQDWPVKVEYKFTNGNSF